MRKTCSLIAALLLIASRAIAQAVIVPAPVPSCANNDVLKWDSATSLFICASAAATSQPLSDVSGLIANAADPTKILKFDVSGIATATTRTWTIPNASITVPTTIASLAANTFTALQTMNGGLASTTGTFSSTLGVTGATTFNTVAYTWPGSQGAASTFLKNDGSGVLSWGTQSAALPNPVTQDLLFTDATYDIGKSGATRPRDFFASRNAVIGGTLGVTGASTIASLSATSGTFSTTLGVTGASTLAAVAATTGTFSSIVTITGNLTLSGTGNAVGTITSGVWNAGAVTSSGDFTYGGNSSTNGGLVSTVANGLPITASHASGAIRFYSGGTTLRMTIQSNGDIAIPGGMLFSAATPLTFSGIATGTGTATIIDSNGNFYKQSSSARYKEHITPWVVSPIALRMFVDLSPSLWDYKGQKSGAAGFMSEDLDALLIRNAYGTSPLINYDTEGRPDSNRDFALIGLQHLVLQNHETRLHELETELATLRSRIQ